MNYDRVAHLYDRTRGWPREVERLIGAGLYWLLSRSTESAAPGVLEVGVGTGRAAVPLAAHGARVYGVDIAAEMIGALREKSAALAQAGFPQQIGVALADAGALPFGAATFDAGLAVHVLHLVPDWRLALAELRRVVRPGGPILFGLDESGTDNAAWVPQRWQEIVAAEGGTVRGGDRRQERTAEAVALLAAEDHAVEEHILARWIAVRTPATIVAQYRERWYSSSWSLPTDVLDRAATRIEVELLAHYGTLHAELERELQFKVIVAQKA